MPVDEAVREPEGPTAGSAPALRELASVRVRLNIVDANGYVPLAPVLVHLSLGGPRHGTIILDPDGARVECSEATFLWRDRDAQGNLTFNTEVELRLGTSSRLVGYTADALHPGAVVPVWGTAEQLTVRLPWLPDGEQVVAIKPEPGKPDHFACWEAAGVPCGDVFRFFPGYLDGRTILDAYHLEDVFGNTVFGYQDATQTQPGSGVLLGFTAQATSGPDLASYRLGIGWQQPPPSGSLAATLSVSYPDDSAQPPDWSAGTVSQAIALEFDPATTSVLMPKQHYDARFALDDGAMPITVAPGATEGGMPVLADGSVPRLVLLALSGTRMPTSLVDGISRGGSDFSGTLQDFLRGVGGEQRRTTDEARARA